MTERRIADLTSSEGELQKIMLCNGKEPRCGVIFHCER